MITKKVQKTDKAQSLRSYTYSVVNYVVNPDTAPDPETGVVNKGEKCVAIYTNCLYEKDTVGMVDEIVDNAQARDAESGSQSLVHRIWSLPPNERMSEQRFIDAINDGMRDLGYTEAHQYIIAIHNDTDNLHAHVVSNRYNTMTGELLEEGSGWDELECRRACVRIEKKYGLRPEPGSRFVATGQTEKVSHVNPFTGEQVERERPCIEQVRKEKPVPDLRDRARWMELKSGLKSNQRVMQEIFTELRPQLSSKMNFGQVYRVLAESGVQAEAVKHGSNYYLTYSLDGVHWEKPSEIHRDFSAERLAEITGSGFRKPRAELAEVAEEARKKFEVHMTDDTTKRMVYSKEQTAALRTIPLTEVRQAFDLPDTDNKKVRNSVDALVYQKGMTYADAVDALAQRFPGVLSGESLVNTIDSDTITRRLELAGVPESLRRTGSDALKQLDAFGAERFHIYGNAPDRNFTSAGISPEGWTKEEVLQNLGYLAKLNMSGGHIYIDPQYGDNKIKIPVDDVQQGFISRYRPSMVLNTSKEKQQAHYVIDRKYEKEFYDTLTENINYRWGDPKIKTADHDSRLAGFTNRKPAHADEQGRFPFVKVEQSTPVRCTDFERYVDEQYVLWKQGKLKPLDPTKAARKLSTDADRTQAMEALTYQSLPPALTNRTLAYQARLLQQYGADIDRSRADFMTADFLYRSNVTTNQAYSFMKEYALQDGELVTRKHQDGTAYRVRKNVTDADRDRHARRTAINAYFNKGHDQKAPVAPLPDLVASRPVSEPGDRWKQEQSRATPAPMMPAPVIDPGTQIREIERQDTEAARVKAEQEAKAAADAAAREDERQRQDLEAARAAEAKAKAEQHAAWLKTPEGQERQREMMRQAEADREAARRAAEHRHTPPSGGHGPRI